MILTAANVRLAWWLSGVSLTLHPLGVLDRFRKMWLRAFTGEECLCVCGVLRQSFVALAKRHTSTGTKFGLAAMGRELTPCGLNCVHNSANARLTNVNAFRENKRAGEGGTTHTSLPRCSNVKHVAEEDTEHCTKWPTSETHTFRTFSVEVRSYARSSHRAIR